MRKQFQLSYHMRILLAVVIYALFFYYVILGIVKADNMGTVIFNIAIGLIFGSIGLLYEYLRIFFDLATKQLTIECNPTKAINTISKVEKADLFKTFKSSCQMERILAYIDSRDFEKLKEFVGEIENSDTNNYDLLLTARYGSMIAYGESNNKGKSNESFKKLVNLRDTKSSKGRRYKGSYYFNWEVVNGQHKNYDGEYRSAYNFLSKVQEVNMNKRELVQYLLARAIAAKNVKELDDFNKCIERLKVASENNKAMLEYIETI